MSILVMALVANMFLPPCLSGGTGEEQGQDIWTEGRSEGPRHGPRPGPRRFKLTDEETDQVIKDLKDRDPAMAKELTALRKKDPEQFRAELRKHAHEELARVFRERAETWRRKIQAEFIGWLQENYRTEAEELSRLKEENPGLYWKKFDLLRRKYWPIFEEEKRNPELAQVLKEDLELRERRDELLRRMKAAENEKTKKQLAAQLEQVVSRRFDLIVQRKQIAYERLLKWLDELKNRIKQSRAEIAEWKDEDFKAENVRKRLKDLTEGMPKFRWD
jgi:hypothetical protein